MNVDQQTVRQPRRRGRSPGLLLPVLALTQLFALACMCGGLGGDGLLGPSPSEQATRLADHVSDAEGVPCDSYGHPGTFSLDGFTYEFLAAKRITAEDRLPWITNSDERNAFSRTGREGLLLEYTVRNDDPVSQDPTYSIAIYTRAGDKVYAQPYNTGLAAEATGLANPWETADLRPDETSTQQRVFAIPHADLEGAELYLAHITKERNAVGRKVRVLHSHAVADLPPLTDGPSLVQEGEGSSGSSRDSSGRRRRPGR